MVSVRTAGVRGRRANAAVVESASRREVWVVLVRQGVDELLMLGEIVSVIE